MSICETATTISSQDDDMSMESTSSNDNIPLFRLPGQASSRATSQPKVEGWMIHFELNDPERRLKHYWILANNAINMYHEYSEGRWKWTERNRSCFRGGSQSEPLLQNHPSGRNSCYNPT